MGAGRDGAMARWRGARGAGREMARGARGSFALRSLRPLCSLAPLAPFAPFAPFAPLLEIYDTRSHIRHGLIHHHPLKHVHKKYGSPALVRARKLTHITDLELEPPARPDLGIVAGVAHRCCRGNKQIEATRA